MTPANGPLALPAVSHGAPLLDVVHNVDCFTLLKALPDCSVNCVVTSPPYFGLRDYGVPGQIGLEPTPQQFVAVMVALFREVRRVLRDDGTCWINLGDSYASGEIGRHDQKSGHYIAGHTAVKGAGEPRQQMNFDTGLPSKNILGIPWRVAFGLQDDGWYLRSDIIWHKPNPMPESVTDRPTKAHEYVFLLTKSERYYYDANAIKEPAVNGDPTSPRGSQGNDRLSSGARAGKNELLGKRTYAGFNARWDNRTEPLTLRNRRTVWTVPTEPTPFAHFATFPRKLIEPMILAGCPVGGVVLDPFMGSGTTALVARANGRHYLGSELNAEYVKLAKERLRLPFEPHHLAANNDVSDLPLFSQVAS